MATAQTPTHYCDTYGFDADWRRARLLLLDLAPDDAALGERLRAAVLARHAEAVVEAFYARLGADAEAREILAETDLDSLKQRQADYVRHFGEGFTEQAYFEERLRIGLVHAWVGVPLSLYLCAHQLMQARIVQHVQQDIEDPAEQRALCAFVSKISALDTSLAGEIYHIAQIRHLESSVTRLSHERRQLRRAADTDVLTGLANRANLMPKLAHALAQAIRSGQPLCVVMADLDHFKRVNDNHGHQVGDQVLRDTASRMRAALRDFDLLARYGGEEFMIVLQNTGLATAREVAERVRQRVGGGPFNLSGLSLTVTISQGIALARAGDSVESLIERADAALYAAKQAGRNRVMAEDDPGRN